MKYKKQCTECGKEFETNRAIQVCCSKLCSCNRNQRRTEELYQQKYKEKNKKAKQIKYCVVCGKAFETANARHKTCSGICSKENELNVKREAYRNRDKSKKKNRKKKRTKKKTGISELARIEQLARQQGMSYGKYVAIIENA